MSDGTAVYTPQKMPISSHTQVDIFLASNRNRLEIPGAQENRQRHSPNYCTGNILQKCFTYFSLAWASEGTVEPLPLVYMLKLVLLTRTCQAFTDDTDPVSMTTSKENCQCPGSHWTAFNRNAGISRNRQSKICHMVGDCR